MTAGRKFGPRSATKNYGTDSVTICFSRQTARINGSLSPKLKNYAKSAPLIQIGPDDAAVAPHAMCSGIPARHLGYAKNRRRHPFLLMLCSKRVTALT
jgi:hypothetical protein